MKGNLNKGVRGRDNKRSLGWGPPGKRNRMCKGTEVWNSMLCPVRTAAMPCSVRGHAALRRHAAGEVSWGRGYEQACVPWEAEKQQKI